MTQLTEQQRKECREAWIKRHGADPDELIHVDPEEAIDWSNAQYYYAAALARGQG